MGDWEDHFGSAGMSADFAPWDDPCWNDDWEQEYLKDNNYKTVAKWNELGRIIKKEEKGIHLKCARKIIFHQSQTKESIINNDTSETEHSFDNFEQAKNWAKENLGKTITRSPDGKGFIAKTKKKNL